MNRYAYEDISVGQVEVFEISVDKTDMKRFLAITNDINPLHNDEQFAHDKGYGGRVVYGMLTASYLSTLAGVYMPGERSLIQSVQVDMVKPVYIGDKLTVTGEVAEKNDVFSTIKLKVSIKNQDGIKVLRGTMRIGILAD